MHLYTEEGRTLKQAQDPQARKLVILTGAGVSAESGIRTFRDANGLWSSFRIEDVASPEAFARDPELVHEFYNLRRTQLLSGGVAPNPAHHALARLDREWPGELLLVTQNVDDLHERAGSTRLLHMHGELLKARCTHSGRVFEARSPLATTARCECCGQPGRLRPHIVWFGELPFGMPEIESALAECDLFAAIGTSGQVYPAAGFVHLVPARARTLELNAESTPVSPAFAEHRIGPASRTVPRWVEELLASARS